MKLDYRNRNIIIVSIVLLIAAGCAKMVAPTGGPKDEQHPLIEEINPKNYSTNFDKKVVKIKFDEFIQLKDLKQNLIVSPLMDTMPEIVVKGKTLQIDIEQTLQDSTTYNIYFGNSVQDYNEGNPIENFQYVFSTGAYVDSMIVQGKVLNSFNLLPEKEVFVMLYRSNEDSLPFKQRPNYISKTNEEGLFRINNIRMGNYKVFCLRDLNKNYLFDLPDEEIAFTDSLIDFQLVSEMHVDTIYAVDSITNQNLQQIDTIISHEHIFYTIPDLTLLLYQEDRAVQYLANSKRDFVQKLEFMFNKAIKDSIMVELPDTVVESKWYIQENSLNNDTVFYWLTDSAVYNKESIDLVLHYQQEDSNLVYQWNTDTLNMRYYEKEKSRKSKREDKAPSITTKLNVKNRGALDLGKNIILSFDQPLVDINKDKINLFNVVDSTDYYLDFTIDKRQGKLRDYELVSAFPEDSTFRLELYSGAFTDISGNTNDTTIVEFKVRTLDSYGKLIANISGIDSTYQAIAQVLVAGKEKEIILREQVVTSDKAIVFELLEPKEYLFKVLFDKNKNGKWDVGDYLNHRAPEEVIYYQKEIKLRANWDFEIELNLKRE